MEDHATLDMLFETMPDDIGVSVSYPLPGTGFYEKVKSELSQKANWTDSDDLDTMFKNKYSAEFYSGCTGTSTSGSGCCKEASAGKWLLEAVVLWPSKCGGEVEDGEGVES
ncbi:MAG: hypothetical protein U0176_10030 [Bacteroidia bacterium]